MKRLSLRIDGLQDFGQNIVVSVHLFRRNAKAGADVFSQGDTGTVQHISDKTWTVTGSQDPDVVYSVGHFSIAVESDIVVTQRPDGIRAQIRKTTVHVYDYYDYHQDEDGFSRSTLSNRLHFIHLAGWAQNSL